MVKAFCSSAHLCFELLVVVGGEGGAAVLRHIHLIHDLCHPLPELVTLLGGQQSIQNHIAILHVLARGRKVLSPSVSMRSHYESGCKSTCI